MKLKCLLFGHKKYNPDMLNNHDIIELKDALGVKLVSINICQRCGAVYSDLLKTLSNKE